MYSLEDDHETSSKYKRHIYYTHPTDHLDEDTPLQNREDASLDPTLYGSPTFPVLPEPEQHQTVAPQRKWSIPRQRRFIILFASIGLILLFITSGVLATLYINGTFTSKTSTNKKTVGAVPGSRMFQLAFDKEALTSLFTQRLDLQQGTLTDLNVEPAANDGLKLNLNLTIDINDFHRVLPIEMDGVISLDDQQNLQLRLQHLKRDGLEADAETTAGMQTAINQMFTSALMPALHSQLKGVKLISVHTSTKIACGKESEMFVLQIEAPPIQGVAAQPTPVPFCFHNASDLNKLLP